MTQAGPFQHISAGGMSLLVHGVFVAFLLLGVTWRSQPQLPVHAELWVDLPASPVMPEPLPELPPEPLPVIPPTEPVKPAAAEPEPAKPVLAKPDIALERAEKKQREKEAREREALLLQEAARQAELLRQAEADAAARVEKQEKLAQAEKDRLALLRAEQMRRESERKLLEREAARQAQEELVAEEAELRGAQQRLRDKSSRHARLVNEFQDRIRGKILSHVRLPPTLVGNPEVAFRVRLLPNGEVIDVTPLRGSGQPAYDREMERAILKASPLPLPNEREVAATFREDLILKFRARDD